ncbi:MAG: hypothetical protein KDB19_13480, partial [Microthrixaceae bacterium]|nr:hypothetical protein [Microthrixaceae bacterium]
VAFGKPQRCTEPGRRSNGMRRELDAPDSILHDDSRQPRIGTTPPSRKFATTRGADSAIVRRDGPTLDREEKET